MATIVTEIDDNSIARITTALCAAGNYQPTINNEPNPQSPEEFAKQMVIDYMMDVVINYEVSIATKAAAQIAKDSIMEDITIT